MNIQQHVSAINASSFPEAEALNAVLEMGAPARGKGTLLVVGCMLSLKGARFDAEQLSNLLSTVCVESV